MKNILKFFAFALVAVLLFNSCEDNYSEEDAMKAQQVIDLIISVTDESNFDVAVEAATVKTVINGAAVELTTDAAGMVTFEDVQIGGSLNIYVSKENYTTTFSSVNTTPGNYRQTTISQNISIYSLAETNTATVKGQLTIETDLTNRTTEVLEGVEVRAFNYSLPNGAVKAFIGTTDAEGKYEIPVPVNADGNDNINVEFISTIEMDRTAGMKKNNEYSVVTKQALYQYGNYNPTYIYAVPSAVIDIAAPSAGGSGLELTTEIDTSTSLLTQATGDYWNMEITKAGSGYFPNITGTDTTIWVPFSPDTKGLDTAHIELTFEKNGGLVSIDDLNNYGTWDGRNAKYSEKPTIDLDLGGGTGAEIFYNFRLNYKVLISNNGTGYNTIPTVKETYSSLGMQYTNNYNLSANAFIAGGSIYANGGAELSTEGRYDSAPTFTIVENDSKTAFAYFTTGDISSSDSTITGAENWGSTGMNYDPANPPAVTITALAGYGANAQYIAEVNSNGTLNDIEQLNAGSGYVRNINDFENDGSLDQGGEDGYVNDSYFNNVLPGDVLVSNAYYGTGMITEID